MLYLLLKTEALVSTTSAKNSGHQRCQRHATINIRKNTELERWMIHHVTERKQYRVLRRNRQSHISKVVC